MTLAAAPAPALILVFVVASAAFWTSLESFEIMYEICNKINCRIKYD
jgi:hypothetical protein